MTKQFPGYVTERVQMLCLCERCGGSGYQATKHGPVKCSNPQCKRGEVWKWINVVRHVTEEEGER